MKTRFAFWAILLVALAISVLTSVGALVDSLGLALDAVTPTGLVAGGVVAAVLLQVLGHVLRSIKHTGLLREIRPIGRMQVFRGQMIGFMFNALLPLRVGEIMRAHYIGRAVQVSRSAVFATIVFERVLDLAVVGALGSVALVSVAPSSAFVLLLAISVAFMLVLVALLAIAFRQPPWFLRAVFVSSGLLNESLSNRVRHIVWSFSHALQYALPNRLVLIRYIVLTLAMWAAYLGSIALLVVVVFGPSGGPFSWSGGLDAPYLGVSTWIGPGFFSQYLVRAEGVLAPGISPAPAELVSFVLLAWSVLVVPSVLLGAYCLLHRELVEHPDGVAIAPLTRNKLFRDEDTSNEFAHLLAAHFQGNALTRVVSRAESAGQFTVMRPLKGGSNASTLLVWQDGRTVVKKVTLPEYRSKLESQYDWLHARREMPEIVDVVGRDEGDHHFAIDIEFRDGYVSFFEYLHASSRDGSWRVLEGVLDFMDARVYFPQPVVNRRELLDRYLTSKVVAKVLDTADASKTVSQLIGYPYLVVNGLQLLNLPAAIEAIRANASAMQDLEEFSDGPIHGDLTIDNLMVDPATDTFMVIDPNDENLISDPLVDYGKIMQSLHSGYEFLVMSDSVAVDGDAVTFEERRSAQYEFLHERCVERFERLLSPPRRRALLFHEAVHYCRMLTYRAAIDGDTVAMYYAIATRLFNEFLSQYPAVEPGPGARPARELHLERG